MEDGAMTRYGRFLQSIVLDVDCFFCCAMGRLGNVEWSHSAWDSAAPSFFFSCFWAAGEALVEIQLLYVL